jgi:hypothetical protein
MFQENLRVGDDHLLSAGHGIPGKADKNVQLVGLKL